MGDKAHLKKDIALKARQIRALRGLVTQCEISELYKARLQPSKSDKAEDQEQQMEDATSTTSAAGGTGTVDQALQDLWQKDANFEGGLETQGIYVVEAIVAHKLAEVGYLYKVKWEGYADLTYEPAEHINQEMLDTYWREKGGKTDPEGAKLHLKHIEKVGRSLQPQTARSWRHTLPVLTDPILEPLPASLALPLIAGSDCAPPAKRRKLSHPNSGVNRVIIKGVVADIGGYDKNKKLSQHDVCVAVL